MQTAELGRQINICITMIRSGLYMIGYGTRKIILKLPPFLNYERGTSRAGNSKSNENKSKNVFVFI